MNVKIGNRVGNTPSPTGIPEPLGNRTQSPAAPTRPPGDRVSVSADSSRLQSLEKSIADSPVVDSARVESIKQAIAEGRFQVNSSVVADRLIASVREVLLGRSG